MNASYPPLHGVEVKVRQVQHHPQLAEDEDIHPYFYLIHLHNHSPHTLRFIGRKWIIRRKDHLEVFEGRGLDGETLTLPPGETLSYNGYHLVSGPARAQGTLFGLADGKFRFSLAIPPFRMRTSED